MCSSLLYLAPGSRYLSQTEKKLNVLLLRAEEIHKMTTFVTIMCHNDELSWLFTKKIRALYLVCRKQPNPSQNFCYFHSLNFHVSASTEFVSKQPTQLIAAHNCDN